MTLDAERKKYESQVQEVEKKMKEKDRLDIEEGNAFLFITSSVLTFILDIKKFEEELQREEEVRKKREERVQWLEMEKQRRYAITKLWIAKRRMNDRVEEKEQLNELT